MRISTRKLFGIALLVLSIAALGWTAGKVYAACGSPGCSDGCFLYTKWCVGVQGTYPQQYVGYVYDKPVTPLQTPGTITACTNGTTTPGFPGLADYVDWWEYNNCTPHCAKDCGSTTPSTGAINTDSANEIGHDNTPSMNTNCKPS